MAQVNWTQSILDQMGQAGKPKKTTTVITKSDEPVDWGQIGLLLALLLGDQLGNKDPNAMIGEIAAPPQGDIPGMALQGLGQQPAPMAATPTMPTLNPGAGVPSLTPQQVQELYAAFKSPAK
jgi:hypothetical protein